MTHRILAIVALAATVASRSAAAQAGAVRYEEFTLPNGLRVITSEDHSTPIVSVDVWYNTGSRNERIGRSGFAHLFEHMMFQGSANVKKAEHFQLIQRAGGSMNGSTSEDRTNYYETVPSNRLNLALWLEADRMRSLAITQENFENQRETVKEERRLGVDNRPYGAAFTDGLTLPFDSTSCFAYAHTVIGSMDDLNAAKLEDVQAFFDLYYAPNNATLVVVGDFDPAELRRLVTEYFAAIPRRDTPPPVTCEAPIGPGAVRREVPDAQANLDAVLRFYRIPEHRHTDTPALELLGMILGQGESSRLNVAVVRRAQAALASGALLNPSGPRRGPGVALLFGIVNQGVSPDRLDSLLTAEVDSVRERGVTAEELTKAKNTIRTAFVSNRESTFSRAEEIHHYLMFHDSLAEINTDLDKFLAVTPEDIRRVARTYLDPANVVTVVVRPAPAGQGTGGGR
ncbi:MAG TPA: pitrilysin family protein [Gemmatimonadales bacterium]|nr:pitrilysin family protein [Gemmatimonadales bacterium]